MLFKKWYKRIRTLLVAYEGCLFLMVVKYDTSFLKFYFWKNEPEFDTRHSRPWKRSLGWLKLKKKTEKN